MRALAALLQGALAADEATRKAAEEQLLLAEKRQDGERPGELSLALADFVRQPNAAPQLVVLAAVILRRVAREQDDEELLGRLLGSAALDAPSPRLQNPLAQVVGTLVPRGERARAKLEMFVAFAAQSRAQGRRNAVECCIKSVKVMSLMADKVDSAEVQLPASLAPVIEAVLEGEPHALQLTRVAVAVRKLAECSYHLTFTRVPAAWAPALLRAAGRPGADSVAVRCEILRALRALSRLERPDQAQLAAQCLQLSVSTLHVALGSELGLAQRETVLEDEYDSDDGEPRGLQALVAVGIDTLCELLRFAGRDGHVEATDVGQLVRLCVRACVPSGHTMDLFAEDPNEFVAIHEDESAHNFARHAAPHLVEALLADAPSAVLAALAAECEAEQPPERLEATLWLLGNAYFSFADDDADRAHLRSLETIVYPLLHRLAPKLRGASGPAAQFLTARVLWAIWACWSRPLASDDLFAFAQASLAAAAASAEPSGVVVGIYACKAISRFVAFLAEAKQAKALREMLTSLLRVLRASSNETEHIALETIRIVLEALGPAHEAIEPAQVAQVLAEVERIWEDWTENDPLVRDHSIAIFRGLVASENGAVADALLCNLAASPSRILASTLDSFRDRPGRAALAERIRRLQVPQRLRERLANEPGHEVDNLDGLRACARVVGVLDPREALCCYECALQALCAVADGDVGDEVAYITDQMTTDMLRSARAAENSQVLHWLGRSCTPQLLSASERDANVLLELAMCILALQGPSWLQLDHASAATLTRLLQRGADVSSAGRVQAAAMAAVAESLPPGQVRVAAAVAAARVAEDLQSASPRGASGLGLGLGHAGSMDAAPQSSCDDPLWSFAMGGDASTASSGEEEPLFASEEQKAQMLDRAGEVLRAAQGRL